MNTNNIRIARRMSSVLIACMMVFLAGCGQTPASTTPTTRTTLPTTTAAATASPTTQFTPVTPTTPATIPSVTAPTTVATTPAGTPTTPTTPATTTFATPTPPTTPAVTPTLSTTTLTPTPTPTSTTPTTTQVTVVTTTTATPPTTQTGTTPVVSLIAQGLAFDKRTITVLAGSAITINFENRDAVAHNFALYVNSNATLPAIFQGQPVTGPATVTYRFLAPTTPGFYFFRCDFHPQTMTGSFVVVGTAS